MKVSLSVLSFFSLIALSSSSIAQDLNPLIGVQLYRSYCLVCHGKDGNSQGPVAERHNLSPADLTASKYQTMSASELTELIGAYRMGDAAKMPNWGLLLPKADLLDIASYISLLTSEDIRFTGDARRGRVAYKKACIACHGQFGRGEGLLAHLLQIPMMDFTNTREMKQMSDNELIEIIRKGKGDSMPSWKGFLSDGEIIDIAAYVRLLSR